jgi:hypothetical protein
VPQLGAVDAGKDRLHNRGPRAAIGTPELHSARKCPLRATPTFKKDATTDWLTLALRMRVVTTHSGG